MAESFSIVIRIKEFFTMKLHNIFILIALFFIASACSSSQPTVATDKDIQEGDFQQYETFTFTKQVLSNDDNQYFENSEALKKTVMNEIKNELQAMGYKYNENEGDLLVNARIFTEDTEYTGWTNVFTEENYWGPTEIQKEMIGLEPSAEVREPGDAETYFLEAGTLMIQMAELESGLLVWQGYASGILDEPKNIDGKQNEIDVAVEQIFDEYNFTARK